MILTHNFASPGNFSGILRQRSAAARVARKIRTAVSLSDERNKRNERFEAGTRKAAEWFLRLSRPVIRFCFLYVLAQLPFMCFYGRMTAAADKKLSASSGIAPLIAGYMFFAAGVVFGEDWSRDHAGDTEFVPAKKLAVGAAISAYICGGFIFCCLAVAGVASLPSLWLVTLGVAAMGWSVCWEYEPDSVYRAYEARGDKKRYFAHSKQTDKIGYPVLFISVAVIILGLILGAA